MINENIAFLRKRNNLSQEELAEKIGISRQTLSKWETGESIPDLEKSKKLSEVLGVTLDDLATENKDPAYIPPKGKYAFGSVKVGDKGQIVIPAKARSIFHIQPGDNLVILGDENQGIAIIKEEVFLAMIEDIKKANNMG